MSGPRARASVADERSSPPGKKRKSRSGAGASVWYRLPVTNPADVDTVSAVVLGILQGVTEFLPVSSSGHIAVGAHFFGVRDAGLSLSIVLHLGTLLATAGLFRKDIAQLVTASLHGVRSPRTAQATEPGRTALAVIVATVPTAVIGLLLKDSVESLSTVLWVVGVCFLVSALLVLTTLRTPKDKHELSLRAALVVGVAQGIAVLPGVSRSGTTIAVAMMLGMSGPAAFRFSFLLSLPAVGGAVLLLLGKEGAFAAVPPVVWLGGLVSLVVGVGSLVALRTVVNQGRLWSFSLYLIPLGTTLILYDLLFRGTQ